MNINIKVIPHSRQRYETCGDYWETKSGLEFRVSKLSDRRYEMLIIIHELIEYTWAKWKGIKMDDIDNFDTMFERERLKGLHSKDEEPGFDRRAPYFKGHRFATYIERFCAWFLGVKWSVYEDEVVALSNWKVKDIH